MSLKLSGTSSNCYIWGPSLTVVYQRKWRESQLEEIQARDEASKAKRQQTIGKAEHAIDQFYEEYAAKKERTIRENKLVKPRPTRRVPLMGFSKGRRKWFLGVTILISYQRDDLGAYLRERRAAKFPEQNNRKGWSWHHWPVAVQRSTVAFEAWGNCCSRRSWLLDITCFTCIYLLF